MLSRRSFMSHISSVALMTALPRTATAAGAVDLTAAPAQQQIAPEGYPGTGIWAINGRMPGPLLRLDQGTRLRARLMNRLPQPTSLHWHGIRIDNAMDGVPGLTQDPVPPGGSFLYDFEAPDAGTYWYHSHAQSVEQVERGLQGPLVVDEVEPPEVDHDVVLVLDDIRLSQEAQVTDDFASPRDRSHAGRLGNLVLTNGREAWSSPVRQGDRLRLRLINSANARIFTLGLEGFRAWQVALDGMPLALPRPVPDRIVLAPAQRVDLIADVTAAPGAEAFLVHHVRDNGYAQAAFPVSAGSSAARSAPDPLPPNPDHPLDLANARQLVLKMEGGAMGRMQDAVFQDTTHDMRSLMRLNQFWALNGAVGRPETPWADLSRGETVRVEMVNDTAFAHAMHIHGMHFSILTPAGTPGPLRDTVLLQPGETRHVAFNAHNPGKWLVHCHMLAHHAAGMGTWVNVRA